MILPQEAESSFAVKRVASADTRDSKNELAVLRRISQTGNTHLINLLASFKLGDSYYFIFPWADGNLRNFWEKNQDPGKLGPPIILWMGLQSLGIAQALSQVHNIPPIDGEHRYGRHGDLKPENILWFGDSDKSGTGLLKITDFGLTRFHRTLERQPREWRCSPTYRPPEFDLAGQHLSPKFDIWSLGCVYLEFLTWLLMGWNAVENMFPTARTRAMLKEDTLEDDSFFVVKRDEELGLERAQTKESVIEVQIGLFHLPVSILSRLLT